MFDIHFQNADFVIIDKPPGVFVHKTTLDPEASRFVVQELRDQLGTRVYPVHRLDRKTSGALLLALDNNTQSELNTIFREREIEKSYLAIVRGHTPQELEIDYALKTERGNLQEAQTTLKTIAHTEIPISSGKYSSSRYSLVELRPTTGRRHQLRRHMAHILHPIIGDRPHGCNKQNKFFLEHFDMNSMLLHAYSLKFYWPKTNETIACSIAPSGDFLKMLIALGLPTQF